MNPDTDKPITIAANAVPRMANRITSYRVEDFYHRFPKLKKFRTVEEGNEEGITLLIGNDYMWSFILPETKIALAEHMFLDIISFQRTLVRTFLLFKSDKGTFVSHFLSRT